MKVEIDNSLKKLRDGGSILYPTDTIWGIGCDATDKNAVQRIFRLKQRVAHKGMIVLIDELSKLEMYVRNIPEKAFELINKAINPLTIVYHDAYGLAENVIGRDGTAAIRVVKSSFCKELIKEFGKPIISTSANVTGIASPSCFQDIESRILNGVDYIVNLHQNDKQLSKSSTIITLEDNDRVVVIRE
ncbi:threonylcarbamoyl-AMP synthase [Candidatus Amoebophilus asiaticus]|nr:threonylcarbamoyl-AMP synthase [Candidatus Amoebophilus asiaticus]